MEKQMVTVSIPKTKVLHTLALTEKFSDFVGQLINFSVLPQRFTFLGCEIKAPGKQASGDNSLRSYAVYMAMNAAIFIEATTAEQTFPEGSIQYNWFEAINAIGMFGKASECSRLACETTFKRWYKEKSLSRQVVVDATLRLNPAREARIKVLDKFHKDCKKELKTVVSTLVFEI